MHLLALGVTAPASTQYYVSQRFALLLKIGFVTLEPPRDSDKLYIIFKGFVWVTCVSDMKIVPKIHMSVFEMFFELHFIYKRHYCYGQQNLVQVTQING